MKKITVLSVVIAGLVGITAFGQTIILKNATNTSLGGNSTVIKFYIIDNFGQVIHTKNPLNGLTLNPGQEAKVGTNILPSINSGDTLFVRFENTYESVDLGFNELDSSCINLTEVNSTNLGNPNIVPNYNIQYDSMQKVKEVNFDFTPIFG